MEGIGFWLPEIADLWWVWLTLLYAGLFFFGLLSVLKKPFDIKGVYFIVGAFGFPTGVALVLHIIRYNINMFTETKGAVGFWLPTVANLWWVWLILLFFCVIVYLRSIVAIEKLILNVMLSIYVTLLSTSLVLHIIKYSVLYYRAIIG